MVAAADESVTTPQPTVKDKVELPAERRCLVVESEAALQNNYGAALIAAGFTVVASHSISDALADPGLLTAEPPAVMLVAVNEYVDRDEPRLQRLQTQLLTLRKHWPLSSLIVLADGTPTPWLHALAVDDLLPKIAPLATLVSRCQQASLRFSRRQPTAAQPWKVVFNNVEEQSDAGLLRFGDHRPRFTLSEYAVFTCLLQADGERCSYAALSKAVGYPADPLSLMALLQALKLRCADTFAGDVALLHIPHFGFRLNALSGNATEVESSGRLLTTEAAG